MNRTETQKSWLDIQADLQERGLFGLAKRVAHEHHVLMKELLGPDRSRPAIRARQALWSELYQLGFWSYPRIGDLFAKDHCTIIFGVRAHRKRALARPPLQRDRTGS